MKAVLKTSLPEATLTDRLLSEFHRASAHVPAYRTLLAEAGVRPTDVRDVGSFTALCPLLTKVNTFDRFPLPQLSVGGVLRDLGCHGIDALLYITGAGGFHVSEATIAWDGETDRKVSSRFELQLPAQTRHGACPVEFVVSWISDEANELVLDFEKARVSCGPGPASGLSVRLSGNPEDIALSLGVRGARTSYQAFFLEWEDFLAATQEWRPGQFAAASSLLTTRLVDAIYRAGGAAA